eukprot:4516507-Amphidinium_carterae.1
MGFPLCKDSSLEQGVPSCGSFLRLLHAIALGNHEKEPKIFKTIARILIHSLFNLDTQMRVSKQTQINPPPSSLDKSLVDVHQVLPHRLGVANVQFVHAQSVRCSRIKRRL